LEDEYSKDLERKREKEAKLCGDETAAMQELQTGQQIVSEANAKLTVTVKRKHFKQASIARMMLVWHAKVIFNYELSDITKLNFLTSH
jgi:hypothetical protein